MVPARPLVGFRSCLFGIEDILARSGAAGYIFLTNGSAEMPNWIAVPAGAVRHPLGPLRQIAALAQRKPWQN
jgi:hypothetical protein